MEIVFLPSVTETGEKRIKTQLTTLDKLGRVFTPPKPINKASVTWSGIDVSYTDAMMVSKELEHGIGV